MAEYAPATTTGWLSGHRGRHPLASWRDDFDGMVASLDETMALAVDACIDGLPDNERLAVGFVHGIAAGGALPRADRSHLCAGAGC